MVEVDRRLGARVWGGEDACDNAGPDKDGAKDGIVGAALGPCLVFLVGLLAFECNGDEVGMEGQVGG
jgi:hypothetical protein